MRPVDWKDLKSICESQGCVMSRMRGDHCVMTRAGMARPAVFPMKRDLAEDIVLGVGRTIGLNRKELEHLLNTKTKPAR